MGVCSIYISILRIDRSLDTRYPKYTDGNFPCLPARASTDVTPAQLPIRSNHRGASLLVRRLPSNSQDLRCYGYGPLRATNPLAIFGVLSSALQQPSYALLLRLTLSAYGLKVRWGYNSKLGNWPLLISDIYIHSLAQTPVTLLLSDCKHYDSYGPHTGQKFDGL